MRVQYVLCKFSGLESLLSILYAQLRAKFEVNVLPIYLNWMKFAPPSIRTLGEHLEKTVIVMSRRRLIITVHHTSHGLIIAQQQPPQLTTLDEPIRS